MNNQVSKLVRLDLSQQNERNPANKKSMQNYLISHVLFDGKEDVLVSNKTGSQRHLAGVAEEEGQQQQLQQQPQDDGEDKFFEAYKQEMERYLSCFSDNGGNKTKKKKKAGATKKEELDKKPILNIGSIRNQFESLASPEAAVESVEPLKPRPKKVGKLDAVKRFEAEKEVEEVKKKEYVPVVIDKDAFERTMCRFENYKDEEEERERRREEQKRKKLEEERLRLEREREEEERRVREEEERKRKIREEEATAAAAAAAARRAEQESKKESVLTKIGNFFTGKTNEQKEASPVKVVDFAEQERLRRMDIQTQIQLELDKIRDLEEKRRIEIEKERKRQELKRLIQMELDKINGLDKSQKSAEDEMPLWMKMIADPTARKAYNESKKRQETESVEPRKTREEAGTETKADEDLPKWVKMVMERQEALQKAKEEVASVLSDESEDKKEEKMKNLKQSLLDLSQEPQQGLEQEEEAERDSRPPMTFQESVQAMLELLEEDKKFESKSKSKLMTKKKENIVLTNVSAVRSQFENVDSSLPTSPSSTLPLAEVNSEKVKQMKLALLQQQHQDKQSTAAEGKTKIDVLLTKKCSTIKNLFERSNGPSEAEEKSKPRPKKSIVQVLETPSIEQQLAEKKLQSALTKWSYKEKSLMDLQQIFSKSESTAQLARKAESVLETSKWVEEEEQKRAEDEQQDVGEYHLLMEQIHQFVDSYDASGKTDDEIAFQNTLNGYLQLIEEDDEYRKAKSKEGHKAEAKKEKKETKKVMSKKIGADIFKPEETPALTSKTKAVKKLDLSKLKFSGPEKPELTSAKKEVNTFNCEMIKDQLEKRTSVQTEAFNPIQRKMKLIGVEQPMSVTQALADLKSRREQEWKWKQKTIGQLQDFLQQNATMTRTMIAALANVNTESETRKKAVESMLEKRQQLQAANNRRNEEFDTFMKDLERFSHEPSMSETDEVFKSSVKSYLELIETQKREEESEIELPLITLPSRMEDLKTRIAESQKLPALKPKKQPAVKKIQSFFGKSESSTAATDKDTSKEKDAPVIGPGKASKLKKMFEEKPKLPNMMRTRSELTLQEKPLKRPKHIIEPSLIQMPTFLSRRGSVKTGSSRFSNVNKVLQDVPDYKKIEQRLNEEGAKSKWDDIQDPEERKKAILAKHGFKPANQVSKRSNVDDVDTIPDHILQDEVLYRSGNRICPIMEHFSRRKFLQNDQSNHEAKHLLAKLPINR